MPSKKKTIEILETFKNYVLSNDSIPDDSDDEPIEAVKPNTKIPIKQAPKQMEQKQETKQAPKEEPKDEVKPNKPETVAQKKKRIQSEAQKLNTQKMREKLAEAQQRKKEEKAEREAMERAILDEKIVKKAISIKKKQIKKEKVLDEISDDETPMEEIIKKIKPKIQQMAPPPPPIPTAPKFTLKFHK
jgi:hypothetical protein